jgi:hypothetical protein
MVVMVVQVLLQLFQVLLLHTLVAVVVADKHHQQV